MSKGKEGEMEFSQKKNSPECLKAREFGEVLGYVAGWFRSQLELFSFQ